MVREEWIRRKLKGGAEEVVIEEGKDRRKKLIEELTECFKRGVENMEKLEEEITTILEREDEDDEVIFEEREIPLTYPGCPVAFEYPTLKGRRILVGVDGVVVLLQRRRRR